LACGRTADKEESAHNIPSERVSGPREVLLGYAGAMASNTGEVLWMPPQWTQMLHGSPMEMDQGCGAVCGASRTHGAQRGGRGNVPEGNAPCPYPTRPLGAAHRQRSALSSQIEGR